MFGVSGTYRAPSLAGVLLCRSALKALKGASWVGSFSVAQCVRHLMGQPPYCSAADAGRVGRGGMVIAPPPTHDLAVSVCFHGCLAFFHWHFPSRFPSSPPLNQSLCNQQQPLLWDFSTIPKLQFPGAEPSRGPVFLSGVCMAASRTV